MVKKILSILLMTSVCAVALAGCSSAAAPSGASSTETAVEDSAASGEEEEEPGTPAEGVFDQTYNWNISTTYATGTPIVDGLYDFADKLSTYSNGTITLNVFPDGTLYDETDAIMAVKSGELEFTDSGMTVITTHLPQYGFVTAPFMLTSIDQLMTLWDSDMIKEARTTLEEEYNTRNIGGLSYRGFRNMSANDPIRNVDDMQGLLLRMNTNAVMNEVFNATGAVCVPLALGELYTSLQTGAVTSSEGPWEQMCGLNLYEVQDYIMETRHIAETSCIWMSQSLYDSLSDDYKAVIDRASAETRDEIEAACLAAEEDYKQQMLDGGCEWIECDTSGMIEKANAAFEKLFEDTWTGITLEDVRKAAGID